MSKKPGELLETFGDFWLGMAGAASKGFAEFMEYRREHKAREGSATDQIVKNVAQAIVVTVEEARKVASFTETELAKAKD